MQNYRVMDLNSDSDSPLPKRQKQHRARDSDDDHVVEAPSSNGSSPDLEFMFAVSPVEQFEPSLESYEDSAYRINRFYNRGKKRVISSLEPDEYPFLETREQAQYMEDVFHLQHFPDLYPSRPSMAERVINLNLPNPFNDIADTRHPKARATTQVIDGVVNGYIKFTLGKQKEQSLQTPSQHALGVKENARLHGQFLLGNNIPTLPAGFGSEMWLDTMDSLLWKFYHTAFCAGRTLFKQTNLWLVDFAQMADNNPCVRHSLLTLSATYVLDYTQENQWRQRANEHYKKASALLEQALQDGSAREPGKEDAVVASLVLLICEDIITWEQRRPSDQTQRWLEGVQRAIEILDQSNPSFNYAFPVNVQNKSSRTANANLIASYEILAQPVVPLGTTNLDHKFKWLLNGTPEEQRRIHGGTGVCPKLLHMFSQITALSASITKDPDCRIIPSGAALIGRRLVNFRQWSEFSLGFTSEAELLQECKLNDQGQVSTAAEVTNLTAQSWVSAAQIYLQCRFYRRARSHLLVKRPLNTLLRCIERMPCTGTLFTSQSPFFAIFIMGVVAVTADERRVAHTWFEIAVTKLGRSSVPPVWSALKELWVWMDKHLQEDSADFEGALKDRQPWWEQMVDRLIMTAGPLSLS